MSAIALLEEKILPKRLIPFPLGAEADRLPGERFFGVLLTLFFVFSIMVNHSRVARVVCGAALLGIAAYWLIAKWLQWRKLIPIGVAIVALWAAQLLSGFFGIDPEYSFKTWTRQHLLWPLIFIAVGCYASAPHRQLGLMVCFVIASTLTALGGIVLFYTNQLLYDAGLMKKATYHVYTAMDESGQVYYRARGMIRSYTMTAMIGMVSIGALLTLLCFLWEKASRRTLLVLGVALIIQGYLLILTQTRGMWIGTAFLTLAVLVYYRVAFRWVLAICVLIILLLISLPQSRNRALTLVEDLNEPDLLFSNRLQLWEAGIPAIRDNPWLGLGYGPEIFEADTARELYPLFTDRWQPDLHQMYLQTLAEIGIIGSIAYVALLIILGRGALRAVRGPDGKARYPAAAFLLLVGGLFIVLAFAYTFNRAPLGLLVWTFAGGLIGPLLDKRP